MENETKKTGSTITVSGDPIEQPEGTMVLSPSGHQCEWRIVEDFYREVSRTERVYAAYCVYCTQTRSMTLKIEE